MSSLVEELQKEALDSSVSVADLLRKALVVTSKLRLSEFGSWVEKELDGYKSTDVPDYRVVRCQLKAFNPYRGYIPFLVKEPDFELKISTRRVREPISSVQECLKNAGDHALVFEFMPPMRDLLMDRMEDDDGFIPSLHCSRDCHRRILEAVRNEILRWSLRLEKDGIMGGGMSFSTEEKQLAATKASDLSPQININITNVANQQGSAIQQGSRDSSQTVVNG